MSGLIDGYRGYGRRGELINVVATGITPKGRKVLALRSWRKRWFWLWFRRWRWLAERVL